MAWTLVNSDAVTFADGNTGHVYSLPSGAPTVGDLDLLFVNSDTVVSTPSGFSLATSNVGGEGSYLWYRYAAGGESSSVTVTTSGNFSTHLAWHRWQGGLGFDSATNAHVDSVGGNSTPAVTTATLAGSAELVVAFAALHVISATMTAPAWSSGYTGATTVGTSGGSQAAGFTGYKAPAGTAAESPSVSWSGGTAADRYILVAAFTPSSGAATTTVSGPARRRTGVAVQRPRVRTSQPAPAQGNPPPPSQALHQGRQLRAMFLRRVKVSAVPPGAHAHRVPPPARRRVAAALIRRRGRALVVATAPAGPVVVAAPGSMGLSTAAGSGTTSTAAGSQASGTSAGGMATSTSGGGL